MKDFLSVVVPVYNKEKYIRKCLDSIFSQTYKDFEVILVDDGSTDSSGMICDEYMLQYDNCMVVHTENGGCARARLIGAEKANGNYITFVDADDWINQNYYSVAMSETGFDIIITGENRFQSDGKLTKRESNLIEGVYERKKIEEEFIPCMMQDPKLGQWRMEPSLCTKIFNRELLLNELRKTGILGITYGEDTVVFYPLMCKISKLKIINEAFYNYRLRDSEEMPGYIKSGDFLGKLIVCYQYLQSEFKSVHYYDVMEEQLNIWFIKSSQHKLKQYEKKIPQKQNQEKYLLDCLFPFDEIKNEGAKILLYGAGRLGKRYYEQINKYHWGTVVYWMDKNAKELNEPRVILPFEEFKEVDFDYFVIAVDNENVAREVKEWALEKKVEDTKIIWHSIRRKKW